MENPLEPMEVLVCAFTGVAGYLASDALDRVLATHALGPSASGASGSDGKPLYGDTPPTTGSYAGLYNATAVLAPMNMWRWAAGVGMAVVPFALAYVFKGKVARSSLQLFGFGALIRLLGKAGTDGMAYFFGRTSWGARMYDGEARAAALKSGKDTSLYPTAGLGSSPACTCTNCVTGVGACCRRSAAPQPPAAPPQSQPSAPPVATQPALPIENRAPLMPSSPQLPMPQQPAAASVFGAAGTPERLVARPMPKRNPYQWGHEGEAA
ncbi:MAG TPA: hypothetical protein VMI75_19715, partial [Polyangiaceae bacterium]|nr:hypothetical protein [Polyangiaceae bacterium]